MVVGFKMPFVLSFTADPAMTERLKSLLFSDCRKGALMTFFLEKQCGGAYRGRGAKWDEYSKSRFSDFIRLKSQVSLD